MASNREEEIRNDMELWKIMCRQRKGFNLTTDDPLFAPRVTELPNKRKRVLHYRMPHAWTDVYFEHGVDFEFTGRIKYVREYGEPSCVKFEITWDYYERTWRTLWKKVRKYETYWGVDNRFCDMYPHDDISESTIEDCTGLDND